ncbi:Rab-GAP TBC domain-containing protein [Caenorhabditis elegans]|uniref:Rab-GAP TBC domain-containing protein n=1 Tax=Caenorhabditis elegans TaxID=6239 RepID=Q17491_CAEEL|nr:Rab-GAP TBC domain-containing protein [Caenorhabditis elegans]CAA86055.1 Rab-GAP TBC domain-containing protein [Caenorhabditis elegans]|eukprot:NP_497979.1 RaB GAP related [Caenorhabditis elegans]
MNSPGVSANFFIPLSFDATSLIKYKLSDDLLARVAASGSLRSSSCRSAVWRLVLRCLPYETSDWEISLSRSRNLYRAHKENHLIDPHDTKFSQDPEFNNPLASIEQNPWNTFFEDNDLRDIIGKDVSRTFPEIEFFQNTSIRQMMSDILLVYAKEHPFVNYRQGMHEILAPLIFVIYSDNEAFQHAKENDELKMLTVEEEDILNCLFCKEYLEQDSYNLFCSVMLEVSRWYEEPTVTESPKRPIPKEPYMRVQDSAPASRLMEDLIDIGNLLHEIDPTLAKHLSTLDIPPQLYGIRWLRLLFGRELPLHDLLFLWDVLLIDRPIAPLAKCMFVSLLVQIRHLLLSSDYGGCLQYLMRYPPIADIDSFVKLARHYRNPKKNAKPMIKSNNFSHITVAGSSHPNRTQRPQRPPAAVNSKNDGAESPSTILALAPVFQKVKNTIRDRSNTVSGPSSPRRSNEPLREPLRTPQKKDNWANEVQMMEEQVSTLQTRLNEQDMMCCQVSKALEIYAEDVRNAKSSELCAVLSQNLLELSKTLMSIKTVPVGTSPPKHSRNGISDIQPKPRDSQPIRQHNEMVDMATKRPPL